MIAAIVAGFKAFAAACGFGEKVVAEVHDGKQREAGADKQTVSNLTTTVEQAGHAVQNGEDVRRLSDDELDGELRREQTGSGS